MTPALLLAGDELFVQSAMHVDGVVTLNGVSIDFLDNHAADGAVKLMGRSADHE